MWTFMQASDAGRGSRESLVVPTNGILHPQTARRTQIELRFFAFWKYNSGLAGESKIVDPKIGPIVSNALVELIVDGSHGRCMQRLRESGHWQLTRQQAG